MKPTAAPAAQRRLIPTLARPRQCAVNEFEFQELNQTDAEAILRWRYEPPLDFYNVNPESLAALLDPGNGYFAAFSGGELVGFCCFGPDAQVASGPYDTAALDIGGGLRPDLTGRGIGRPFLKAILGLAQQYAPGQALRATVAAFNIGAIRTVKSVGFLEVARFRRPTDGIEFVMLLH